MNGHSILATVTEELRPMRERFYSRNSFYRNQPCDSCAHYDACRRTGHECKAFRDWQVGKGMGTKSPKPGRWYPKDRVGP